MLSDGEIADAIQDGEIFVAPFHEDDIQPASIDLHLGDKVRIYDPHRFPMIDPLEPQDDLTVEQEVGDYFVIHPGAFVLGVTRERIEISPRMVARLDGKSSLARLGLLVHVTGGFIDPGWRGQLTLEMSNVNELPIRLRAGMKIAQIGFDRMARSARYPYGAVRLGSKYQDSAGPIASRFHLNASVPARATAE